MTKETVMNRWYVVIGAILIQLCLGAIYAWSVFTPKLTLSVAKGGMYGFSATQAAWIFSVGLLVFAVTVVISGKTDWNNGVRESWHPSAESSLAPGTSWADCSDLHSLLSWFSSGS